jgi:hypothetical protein
MWNYFKTGFHQDCWNDFVVVLLHAGKPLSASRTQLLILYHFSRPGTLFDGL